MLVVDIALGLVFERALTSLSSNLDSLCDLHQPFVFIHQQSRKSAITLRDLSNDLRVDSIST